MFFRHLLEAITLVCPFSVLIRCESLTASHSLLVFTNLHDTEGPRGLLQALQSALPPTPPYFTLPSFPYLEAISTCFLAPHDRVTFPSRLLKSHSST